MESWSKRVKIRKPHQCHGCGREFKKGDLMEYSTTVDGGQFSHAYWCMICVDVINGLEDWETRDGFLFGDIINNYREEWNIAEINQRTDQSLAVQ